MLSSVRMPHKGFFTQGVMILTERVVDPESVERVLAPFTVGKRRPAEGEKNWISGYPTWVIPHRLEVNGLVIVDVIDAPWPDDMGDPQSPDTSKQMLFGAWSMGFMGPFSWPGNLARAKQLAEALGSPEAVGAADRHNSFIRIRSSYAMGGGDDAPIIPDDYDAPVELEFVTSVARALARVPGALCYFNPGGETLFTPDELEKTLHEMKAKDLPPLQAWSAVRLTRPEGATPWTVVDTVGMGQLDVDDHEACFRSDQYEAREVADFVRNTTLHVLRNGPVIKDGHTTDGPGGRWRAMEAEESLMPAPRAVLRWFPEDGSEPPARMRQRNRPAPGGEKRGILGRIRSMFGRGT
jgi:hypothetical protein